MAWLKNLRITKNKAFLVWGILFLLFYAFYAGMTIYAGDPESLLIFCVTVVLLFGIGLIFEDELILSSVLVSTVSFNLPLSIDLFFHLFTGQTPIGAGGYLRTLSPLRYAVTFYHVFLLVIPIYVHLKTKKFHRMAWVFSSIHYLAVCLLSLAITTPDSTVNFVRGPTDLVLFYPLKPDQAPYFIFHWIAITLIFFIPTHYIAAFVIKRRVISRLFAKLSRKSSQQSG